MKTAKIFKKPNPESVDLWDRWLYGYQLGGGKIREWEGGCAALMMHLQEKGYELVLDWRKKAIKVDR
jgi:hypothetical protein